MSARSKTYFIYGTVSILVFVTSFLIMSNFFAVPTFWTTLVPIGATMLMTPKPHIVLSQSGDQYGLKSIFSKKIIPIK